MATGVFVLIAVGEGDAWNACVIVEDADVVPAAKKISDGVGLAVAEFEGEKAFGAQRFPCERDEATVDGEAVCAGEEGEMGLVLDDFALHGGGVGGRDVGWVRDDGVEEHAGLQAGEEIAFSETYAVAEAEAEGVVAGELQREQRDVSGEDFEHGLVGGECERDGSGACADVEDVHRLEALARPGEDSFDEVFGFRARDEGVRGDAEFEAEEFLQAEEVLQWDGCGAALCESAEGFEVCFGQWGFGVSENPGARLREGVGEQELGVAAGDGSFGDGFGDGHALLQDTTRSRIYSCCQFL
jgi:hypothetical protein